MDRAYEDDKTRQAAKEAGFIPVIPPKRNRKEPWGYDTELYKRRNEVERFFLRIKRFRLERVHINAQRPSFGEFCAFLR